MNNYFKLITLFFISALFLNSCQDNEKFIDIPSNGYVYFVGNSAKQVTKRVSESEATPTPITLNYSIAGEQTQSFSVPFTLSGAPESDYVITDNVSAFVFEPGQTSSTIYIKPVNNQDTDGSRTLTITLGTPTNGANAGYLGPDNFNSVLNYEILDDDCNLDPASFVGTPSGTDSYGARSYPSQVQFTLDSTTQVDGVVTKAVYSVTGLIAGQLAAWSEPIVQGGTFKLELDNSDPSNPSVKIYELSSDPYGLGRTDFYAETQGSSSLWGYFLHDNTSGVNTFSTCNKTLTFTYWVDVRKVSDGTMYNEDGAGVLKVQF